MKTIKKVISHNNLPASLPFFRTLVLWLFLDRISAPEWVWGVYIALVALHFIASIVSLATETRVDIFEDKSK